MRSEGDLGPKAVRGEPFIRRLWRRIDVSHPSECWLYEGAPEKDGYARIQLTKSRERRRVHRAAWEDFYGPIADGMQVLHSCDTPLCCNPYHLFLGTNDQNMADMKAKGRAARGVRNANARLTERDVREIRASADPYRVLAERYGVTTYSIEGIRLRKSWRHVDA